MGLPDSHLSTNANQARGRNAQQPILCLSPELFTKIFKYALEDEGLIFLSRVVLVCTRFSEIIHSSPTLWTKIDATTDPLVGVRVALEKSKGQPLQITGYPGANEETNTILLAETARWESLHLALATAESIIPTSLPILRSFEASFNDAETFSKAVACISTPKSVHYTLFVPWDDVLDGILRSKAGNSAMWVRLAEIATLSTERDGLELVMEMKEDACILEFLSSSKVEGSFRLIITSNGEVEATHKVLFWTLAAFVDDGDQEIDKLLFRGFKNSFIDDDGEFWEFLERTGWATVLAMQRCSTEFSTAVVKWLSRRGSYGIWNLGNLEWFYIDESGFPEPNSLVEMFKKRGNRYGEDDKERDTAYLPHRLHRAALDLKWKEELSSEQISALEEAAGAGVIDWW